MLSKAPPPIMQPWEITADEGQAISATDMTFDWLCHVPAETLRPFAGKWIAARDCRIVASAETMDALLAELGEAELPRVIIHHIKKPGLVIYR